MSRLRIFADDHPDQPLLSTSDQAEMARELSRIGVAFEQWQATQPVTPGASSEDVMTAYRGDIDRLVAQRGFRSVDVVSIAPDHPDREQMRGKFLDEHFHKEDEVRFFVAGSGLFTLHVDGRVYEVLCEAGRPHRGSRFDAALVRHGPGTELRRHPLLHRARRLGRPFHRHRHREEIPSLRAGASRLMATTILTDIEGTTSSISFVKDVLFPYARRELPRFVREHGQDPEVRRWLDAVATENGGICSDDVIVETLQGWIDQDRKHTALKALQGMLWRDGYMRGDFRGHVYPDAVAGVARLARGRPSPRGVFFGLGRRAETVVRP